MKLIKKFVYTYKEPLLYFFFGGCTTFVNIVVFALLNALFQKQQLQVAVWGAWFVSVLFAYVTNKLWVFEAKGTGRTLWREILLFFAARLFSGIFDSVFMEWNKLWLHQNELAMKILSNIIVVVLNYVFSKWVVFGKKGHSDTPPTNNM